MKAVNLVPREARGRSRAGRGLSISMPESLGVGHLVIGVLVVIVALVVLRVLAGNDVKDKQATLAAVQAQVSTEQAQAAKLNSYVSFASAAEQRISEISSIADQRFAWQQTFDRLSRVMPASTQLTSLTAATGASTSTTTGTTTATGPTFSLAGCVDTPNQNGTATLLRRLHAMSGVTGVSFQTSQRQAGCGNSFSLSVTFAAPGSTASGSTTATDTSAPEGNG